MKKIIILILVSLFLTGLLFSNTLNIVQYEPDSVFNGSNRDDTVIFIEDFENGIPLNWSSEDVTDPGSYWFTSPYNAFGEEGSSWRMADTFTGNNGGYLDGWYQVLDTPIISLPGSGNMVLSFEQYRAIEEPGNYENFDGWDGLNVRIRLAGQDYENAEILTNCNPAYNCNSLYGFGEIHGEDPDGDPGIPGWGGSTAWQSTEVVIPTEYHGENVIISFAFASDENTSTATNPDFSGIFIDEIDVAGVFYNDGESTAGFNGFTNTPIGGDLWHAFTQNGNSAAGCFDVETNLYNSNMKNYLTTGSVFLPADSEIYVDLLLQTALDDSLFPDCDYFSVEVSYYENDEWSNWNSISNPTGDPNLLNVVFTGSVDNWTLLSEGWAGYNDLSAIAGQYAKFRLGFHSNGNTPSGFGIKIDDFKITASSYAGMPPSDLVAILLNDYYVQLYWGMAGTAPLEFNIYRKLENNEFEFIASSTDVNFIDNDPFENEINIYAVTAVFAEGESDFSNLERIFVPNQSAEILQHDDGTVETGILLLNLQKAAVLFEPDFSSGNVSFTHLQIYLDSISDGPLVISAWQNDNDLPDTELTGFPISIDADELQLGWNTIEIPSNAVQEFSSGSFFAGYIQFVNSPQIGLDEDSSGFSYDNANGWNMISSGELMIRTIVDTAPVNPTSNDPLIPVDDIQLSNYPNPFNPTTTISFNLVSEKFVELDIYNTKGQLVRNLIKQNLPAGNQQIIWQGKNNFGQAVGSGVYYYKIRIENIEKNKKMLLMK
ncbi:MAG: T9SS type A sorting domain-containing protein [Candidatus Cloacimonetes bacterium]|nr:T9SS type A sorting domain-containing protein [Candidatus Cloacimonadota bacterium]MCF7813055.1 T9SS type A sorting domain-containing protein [Candidatus Cloacimonadota bacterium]MCF7867204.1 T9SS type A sorting domain-containing protein [Candidatus Cloacimonadota bacterium]MCF7882648.1 T9SS type A sorting domain-containing protein [Candidatus Cloacimonadota bacterium]